MQYLKFSNIFCILVLFSTICLANPFESKFKIDKKEKIQKLIYQGYLNLDQTYFASLELNGKHYLIQENDTITNMKILKINPNYLVYTKNEQTFKIQRTIPKSTH